MNTKALLTLLLIFSQFICFCQIKNDSLIYAIKNADKILLTSHSNESDFYYKQSDKKIVLHDILIEEKPNETIIKEKIVIDSINKTTLINLLLNQNPEENFEGAFCFQPHHTIFILINKKWEYIDVCFGCDNYYFSNGLNINRKMFLKSYEDWRKLESFFRSLNLIYKLPKLKD